VISGNSNGLKSNVPASITITVGQPGKITLFANGKRVPGCISVQVTSSISCNWKPPVRGVVTLSATLIPNSSSYLTSLATPLNVTISARSNTR
jgi:hypothetical protein